MKLPFNKLLEALQGKVVSLHGDQYLVGGSQGIDGQHTQRRAAVQQDHVVLVPDNVHILPQDGLPAHGVHQRDLQARQLDVGGEKVHTLLVVDDARAGGTVYPVMVWPNTLAMMVSSWSRSTKRTRCPLGQV